MMASKWDTFFVDMAEFISTKSKDRNTKIGCVIVGPDNELVSMGYNGFPRGIRDGVNERHERPLKYEYVEHSERNALDNAARIGIAVKDCSLYLSVYPIPCTSCTRSIIQCGIREVVGPAEVMMSDRWTENLQIAKSMLDEAGVIVRAIEEEY